MGFDVFGIVTVAAAWDFSAPAWVRFLGRLHPLVVHFPIALVLTAGFFEFVRMPGARRRAVQRWRAWSGSEREPRLVVVSRLGLGCLALGTLAAVFTAITGWTNAEQEAAGTSADLHRWLGVATTAVLVLALCFAAVARVGSRAAVIYRVLLLAACASMGATGHFGGSLVHGDGYLLGALREPTPAADVPIEAIPDATELGLVHDVETLLADRCYRCHGPERRKGKLRLDDRETAVARKAVVPGAPEESAIIRRVSLSPDDEDIMPPEGDPLTAEQIELLRRWIEQGAPWGEAAVAEDDEVVAPTPRAEPRLDGEALARVEAALERVRSAGGHAARLSEGSDAVEVDLRRLHGDQFEGLGLLDGLEPVLVELNLAGRAIGDEGVAGIARFTVLERLHLERTGVTDAGVRRLVGLDGLVYLNLYGTAVTDSVVETLAGLPALQSVYLWETDVTAEGAGRLRERRPELAVERAD
jgi:uncharacterized membrane protein